MPIVNSKHIEQYSKVHTWESPVRRLINEIGIYKATISAKKDNYLKKIERNVQHIRNKLIGKERYRKIRNKVLQK
ncbi:hypothetical protein MNBD_GAMMA26-1592 [hydrothermal vent metagenome]|uniref:Uncharacterized protein n=1 Tax=hydrothermal vent metagenome TaxID=652676 RepID=A0A3B1B0P4_9ZZZZ